MHMMTYYLRFKLIRSTFQAYEIKGQQSKLISRS